MPVKLLIVQTFFILELGVSVRFEVYIQRELGTWELGSLKGNEGEREKRKAYAGESG